MKSIRAQFWIKYRGCVDIPFTMAGGTAEAAALYAVTEALEQFNRRWPGARREELVCTGLEDRETGRVLNGSDVPLILRRP